MTDDDESTRTPNSRARQVSALKSAYLTIMNPEQLRQITERLVAMAVDGNTTAAKILFDRAFDSRMSDGQTQTQGLTLELRRKNAAETFARDHGSD